MNPQYPEQNPYDFIMNPNQQQPKRAVDLNGKNGFFLKIGLIVGGVIILMIGITIAMNMLTGSKTNTDDLKLLAQTQQEIIRVSTSAQNGTGIRDQALKNFAANTQLTLATQQAQLVSYLEQNGAKMNNKQLALKKDDQTDATLAQARATSTYDIAFKQVIKSSLSTYASEIQTNYNNASAADVRTYLKKSYDQTQLLIQQLPADTATEAN